MCSCRRSAFFLSKRWRTAQSLVGSTIVPKGAAADGVPSRAPLVGTNALLAAAAASAGVGKPLNWPLIAEAIPVDPGV